MKFKNKITKKLLKIIPGGSHTYSRGPDQYPINAPQILSKGKGVYVYDEKGKKYLDYGMGLRSVNIGYSEPKINKAAIRAIKLGNNLTRPSITELKSAELFVSLFKNVDMVKFAKNGSTAVTAAIKLARAYTKKDLVLRCLDHPFFSYDDWFIGSTNIKRGIPKSTINLTKTFKYNDISSLKEKIKKYKNKISCVVLEPSALECPMIKGQRGCCMKSVCERNFKNENHFLKEVAKICKENKIIFILDEMITGFRWHLGGAQSFYNVNPDISTFGKAMANGFSVSAVCGKKKYMELGSITKENEERVFLLSTTHGAEMCGLGAFIETTNFLKSEKVIQKNWKYGEKLIFEANKISKNLNLQDFFRLKGVACSPYYECLDSNKKTSLKFRTLFLQEMLKENILMPWISISYRHTDITLDKTLLALEKTLYTYKKAINNGIGKLIKGHVVKPVFRKFN